MATIADLDKAVRDPKKLEAVAASLVQAGVTAAAVTQWVFSNRILSPESLKVLRRAGLLDKNCIQSIPWTLSPFYKINGAYCYCEPTLMQRFLDCF
jgi:hypothetical protein